MKRVRFYYSTKLTMNHHVHNHSYLFRCIPMETASQHVVDLQFSMKPNQMPHRSTDAFGNVVLSGYIPQEHRYLDFTVRGVVERDDSVAKTDLMSCYLYPSPMTKMDTALSDFAAACAAETAPLPTLSEKITRWMALLAEKMEYTKQCTDIQTTAAEAFALGKGVCQDYTHIFLCLLRSQKIPCRYIAGLAFHEGETHSWLEYWNGEQWIGIDPTNNTMVDESYVILSQGRDSLDCSLNRGVMFGAYTQQMQLVESKLEHIY